MSRYTLKLLICAIFICMIQPYIFPWWFPFTPLLPICYRYSFAVNGKRKIDGIICGFIYGVYFAIIMFPFSFLFNIPYCWCLLSSYSSSLIIYNRDLLGLNAQNCAENMLYKLWLDIFFNPPLLMSWNIVSYFDGQLMAPLSCIIDENICIGCLPCSKQNVLSLYKSPFHVRCVINLCDETVGPSHHYKEKQIEMLRIPTLDATEPSIQDINKGIKFIKKYIKYKQENNNKNGRVFIHCKGGVGRSVTMALCWFLFNKIKPHHAMHLISSKRVLASTKVLQYKTVQHFIKNAKN